MDVSDSQLLEDYVRRKSEQAFGALVQRYVNLVHGAARRQVRDAHLAEDVTQATFIVLARRAGSVSPERLAGWLLKTARFCARDALKKEGRRIWHEKEAVMSRTVATESGEIDVDEVGPVLDEAMSRLGDRERTAVALRFLQDRSIGDVAAVMGTTVHVVQKVILRSLPKLRRMLERKGILVVSTAVLSEAMLRESAHAAPARLATSVTQSSAQSLSIAKGAMNMMRWTKIKVAAGIAAAVLLAGGAGTVALNRNLAAGAAEQTAAAPAEAPAAAISDLMGFNSPFLELVGCQIKQKIDLKLTADAKAPMKVIWTEQQHPQIRWTCEAGIAEKANGYAVSIAPVDGPAAARSIAVEKSRSEIDDGPTDLGEYLVKVTANGTDGKAIADAAARVVVEKLPSTQIQIEDIQADGSIRFTSVLQQMNEGDREVRNGAISYSDMFHIDRMTDEQGVPVQFTVSHTGQTYRFRYRLNRAVEPGEAGMGSTSGLMTNWIKKMPDGTYLYAFDHMPGGKAPVRRIELYRLPVGAVLAGISPSDLPNKLVDGQVQVFVNTEIPVGGHHAVEIRYRLGEGR